METHVYHTVNCGLYFVRNHTGILVDGLHDGREFGYSRTPESVLAQCRDRSGMFADLKALLFTHRHEDHFDEKMVREVMKSGGVSVYAPGYAGTNIPAKNLRADIAYFEIGDFRIYAVKTIHDGDAALRAAPHVSFIINTAEETFFLAGDATFREEEADKVNYLCAHWIDAAFVNAYQIISDSCRSFLRKLDPERLFLIHRPFREDDKFDIFRVFETAKRQYPADLPPLKEPGFNQWVL